VTTVAIPTSPDELREMLADTKKMGDVLKDPKALEEFVRSYAAIAMTDELKAQVKEGIEAGIVKFAQNQAKQDGGRITLPSQRSPLDLRPAAAKTSAQRTASYWPEAPGACLDKYNLDLAGFARLSYHNQQDPKWLDLRGKYRNDYSSVVPAEGGFLVPEALSSQLMQLALEGAIVRPRAMVLPMTTQTLAMPAVDETTHVGSLSGGITTQWAAEGQALTASEGSFGRVVLQAAKLCARADVPSELLADSLPAFAEFIQSAYPSAIAFAEDQAFLTGDGVGEPLGFLNAASRVAAAAEAGQAANTIVWENILHMYCRMLPSSLGRAVWIASIDSFPELYTMGLSVGTGGGPVMINFGGGTSAPVLTILGRPVIFTEKVPTIGHEGDLAFVDLGYYLIGDRKLLMAESSAHFRFGNDVVVYRFIERVDGRPWLLSSITPANGGAALSAYVTIADRL
jgi:HK97 family phage major capsid protein